jgi:hypothetical protein
MDPRPQRLRHGVPDLPRPVRRAHPRHLRGCRGDPGAGESRGGCWGNSGPPGAAKDGVRRATPVLSGVRKISPRSRTACEERGCRTDSLEDAAEIQAQVIARRLPRVGAGQIRGPPLGDGTRLARHAHRAIRYQAAQEPMDKVEFSPTKDGSVSISAEQLRSFVDRIERLEQARRESPTTSRIATPRPRRWATTSRSSGR